MNLLLDTNVIIDYMGRQKPFFENAERIIAAGYFGDATLKAECLKEKAQELIFGSAVVEEPKAEENEEKAE